MPPARSRAARVSADDMKRRSTRLAAAATAKEADLSPSAVALMELPHELLALVACSVANLGPAHAGMALIRVSAACLTWKGLIDDKLWKTAALMRFPRLIPLLALEARRPLALQADPAVFRTHYQRQLHAETLRQRESDDAPVLLGNLPGSLLETNNLAFSIELQADGVLVGSWTGHYKRPWLREEVNSADPTRPRLWSIVPAWFSKLVAAAERDRHSYDQADPVFARRHTLSLYVTNGMRTVPLFRDVAPSESEPESGHSMLLHFAPEVSLPRLLKLGHDGKSTPTWFVYLLADGTVQLNLDLMDKEEQSIIEIWSDYRQKLVYLSLLIMRFA